MEMSHADTVISVENLSKSYLIGHDGSLESGSSLRETFVRHGKNYVRRAMDMARGRQIIQGDTVEDFWALTDVSFEVKRGEVLGIIGRNGAGKSTLLKVLSRITEPTSGRVVLEGRVASLLEVGTGFHPELSGRENIFLNGAILGMSKAEIKSKFDEIVLFAGVGAFLDTPVKRYSSGLYVRLAFAVAAHLEPEILIIDEVLAVGDAEFQKKCLGKMQDVAKGGRTVIFVSHNMNAVEGLCGSALCLDSGRVRVKGKDVRRVVNDYLSGRCGRLESEWYNKEGLFNHPMIQPIYFAIVDHLGRPLKNQVRNDEQVSVVIHVEVRQPDPALKIGFVLFKKNSEQLLCSITTDMPEDEWPILHLGINELRCDLPTRLLNEGNYFIELHCSLHNRDWVVQPEHNSPSIEFSIRGGLSDSPHWVQSRPGVLAPELKWTSVPESVRERGRILQPQLDAVES